MQTNLTKKYIHFLIVLLIFLLDQLTKKWVLLNLLPGESLYITPFLNLTLVFNTGAAFSLLQTASGWQNMFFTGVALFISVMIIIWFYYSPTNKVLLRMGLASILGGALGNVLDRLMRGYVVDFIDLHISHWHWPVFNVADAGIFIGVCLIGWSWYHEEK